MNGDVVEDRRPWQPGDGDTRCQGCGFRYQPWFTDNWLWNTVMGGDEFAGDPGGYLCPRCFGERTDEQHPNLVWRFIPEWSGKAPLMDFPAARTAAASETAPAEATGLRVAEAWDAGAQAATDWIKSGAWLASMPENPHWTALAVEAAGRDEEGSR